LQQSHIVSEFFHKEMYDDKHRFLVLSSSPERKEMKLQKGVREKLLCRDCEQLLSPWERYANEVLHGATRSRTAMVGNKLLLRDLDYAKTRLCFLSLLWRMSISSYYLFNEVRIGKKHEERIRQMLLNADAGEPDDYGFLCFAPLINGSELGPGILQPDSVRLDGHRLYRCLIGGMLYVFFVTSHKVPDVVKSHFLQRDGSWVIITEDVLRIDFLRDAIFRIGQAICERGG